MVNESPVTEVTGLFCELKHNCWPGTAWTTAEEAMLRIL
jgi:hypothetical protein